MTASSPLGWGWTSTFQRTLVPMSPGLIAVYRPDGRLFRFSSSTNRWIDPDALGTLTTTANGWAYRTEDDEVEYYDSSGRLVSLQQKGGVILTLAYAGGQLATVSDSFGQSLAFAYDAAGRIATLTDPAGGVFRYAYDGNGNLAAVTYPDNSQRQYLYEDSRLPHALTGIVDENGQRLAIYAYDVAGRAILTEHSGGAGRITLAYNPDGTTTLTDALGTARTYAFQTVNGVVKLGGNTLPCPDCGPAASTYDAQGNTASQTDFNGNRTTYGYDLARNLETSRTEAAGTPEARTLATQWHPIFRLPTQIAEPGRTITHAYDGQGNRLGKTVTDTATGQARTWAWTYNAYGQVLTEDGPRTDVNDLTTYTYDDATGHLLTVVNATGHTTTYSDYDAHGRPKQITDPNGGVVTLAYDARGRLTRRTEDGQTTTYGYDPSGNLIRLTLPNGAFYAYSYDAAHRLTDIADAVGNHLHYTLDGAGNRLKEEVFDPANTLVKTHRRVFDALSRLSQDIGAYNQTTTYGYDGNGNVTSIQDPNRHTTAYAYDALNRLTAMTDALANTTVYRYDALDHRVSVTDANQQTTTYAYDALDNLTRQTSPNTGTTVFGYDAAGNRISRLEANNVRTLFRYDALNRTLQADYPGTADDIAYGYDDPSPGNASLGRLSQVANGAARLNFGYDLSGRIISTSFTPPGQAAPLATVAYQYDAAGQLSAIRYPSGREVAYPRDAAGRIAAVTLDFNGQTTMLASNLSYQPFGPLRGLTFGNGLAWDRSFDLDGRLIQQSVGAVQDLGYGYDPAGNLATLTDSLNPSASQTFGYDALDRLVSAMGGYGSLGYAYDPVGNRLTENRDGAVSTYAYAPGRQRLQSIAGAVNRHFAYDANGNTVRTSEMAFTYGVDNRLRRPSRNGLPLAEYAYDPLGQRVSKTVGGATSHFVYAPDGKLLSDGSDYVYLDDLPIAMLNGQGISYVHASHLGTPLKATDGAGNLVWAADHEPFGKANVVNSAIALNLRFPGQYFDAETGLHYNYFRDYDPILGRYIESDPIGLKGGLNMYVYVVNNPNGKIDPFGLKAKPCCTDKNKQCQVVCVGAPVYYGVICTK